MGKERKENIEILARKTEGVILVTLFPCMVRDRNDKRNLDP